MLVLHIQAPKVVTFLGHTLCHSQIPVSIVVEGSKDFDKRYLFRPANNGLTLNPNP